MVETQARTKKTQTPLLKKGTTNTKSADKKKINGKFGLAKGMKKYLFQAVERAGEILVFCNKNSTKDQPVNSLLDTLDRYGLKGRCTWGQAQQCVNYWYDLHYNGHYDRLYSNYGVKPLLATISQPEEKTHKKIEEETEEKNRYIANKNVVFQKLE